MITRQKKEVVVSALVEKFKGATGLYFIDFTGLSVKDTIAMRRAFKEKGITFYVAKNTLIRRAMAEVGVADIPDANMFGQTGVAFAYEDSVAPAKVLVALTEKKDKPRLKAAILDGQFFDGALLKTIAALPGKQEILSGIVFAVSDPASGIVGAINAVMRDVASLVEEVAKKQHAA